MKKTLYQTLGVDPGASPKQIRAAFRRMVKKAHPDLNRGDASAPLRFREILAAYRILNCEESRRRYDEGLSAIRAHWRDFDGRREKGAEPGGVAEEIFRWARSSAAPSRESGAGPKAPPGVLPGARVSPRRGRFPNAYTSARVEKGPLPKAPPARQPPPGKREGFFRSLWRMFRCLLHLLFHPPRGEPGEAPWQTEREAQSGGASFQDHLARAARGVGGEFVRGPDGVLRRSSPAAADERGRAAGEALRTGALGLLLLFLTGLWETLRRQSL